jgi:hypothetical protein
MHAMKFAGLAMEDSHQIDHHIVVSDQRSQRLGVEDIGLDHLHAWQHLHRAGWQSAGGDGDLHIVLLQGFAQVTPDKPGAPQNQNALHDS